MRKLKLDEIELDELQTLITDSDTAHEICKDVYTANLGCDDCMSSCNSSCWHKCTGVQTGD